MSWKEAVRLRAQGNIDLSNALENGDTIDGVVLATGDRVLCDQQTTGSQDGVYVVPSSGAASRATDWAAAEQAAGWVVAVQEGTVDADRIYICTDDGEDSVIDDDDLTFAPFADLGPTGATGDTGATGADSADWLPVKPSDGDYYLQLSGGTATWEVHT